MAKKRGHIYVGTSGWLYDEWKGIFYPKHCAPKDFLDHYMTQFSTVELNNSFYRLPKKATFTKWYKQSSPDFIFAVKASRYTTHVKYLADPYQSSIKFFKVITPLKQKLGPVLFQLPPHWKCRVDRLEQFLKILPAGIRYTFELRNPTWFNDDIYALLRKYNAAFCIYDFNKRFSPEEVTADFIYLRLHGPKGKYIGSYPKSFLKSWAGKFKAWSREGKDSYCYFDNTADGAAVKDALYFQDLVT
jgi:uncharacterized protein YecE (DUF72 family)